MRFRFPVRGGHGRVRGSVIVLVLAMIVLAGFFLSQFIERAVTEMLVESRARQSARLRVDAHSALEASLAVIADYQAVDGGLHSPAQGWGEPLERSGFEPREGTTVVARVEDESGRISLPRLGTVDLRELGQHLGLKPTEATDLADALVAWTHRDYIPTRFATDPRQYAYEDPPHDVAGRPIASFDELAAIAVARDLFYTKEGNPTKLRGDFERSVSLRHFPAINLNTARLETLVLAGIDPAQAERIVAYNAGEGPRAPGAPPYFRSLAEAQSQLGVAIPLGRFDTKARCLRVTVTVREGATVLELVATIAPAGEEEAAVAAAGSPVNGEPAAGNLAYPFKVLAFEEIIQLAAPPAL